MNGVISISLPTHSVSDGGPRYGSPSAFVVGPENLLAGVALRSALNCGAPPYHPLVFSGPAGSGKSHLARGIAADLSRQQPNASQVAVTAAEFCQEYSQAQHARDFRPLRTRYRTSTLLVIEDLPGLSAKGGAQQELAYTLDAIADSEGLAIVTSRESPQALGGLSAALCSRLSAGLEVRLSLPGPQARLTILEELAAARGSAVPPAACRILAEGLKAGVPELIAALSALEAAQQADGKPIDVLAARLYVAQRSARSAVGVRGIAAVTAKHFKLRIGDLKSSSRQRPVVQARGVAMWLARQLTPSSLGQIGSFFGGRDHSTVLHGCRRTEELLKTDPETREAVGQLRAQLVM